MYDWGLFVVVVVVLGFVVVVGVFLFLFCAVVVKHKCDIADFVRTDDGLILVYNALGFS